MADNSTIKTAVISALVGSIVAIAACLIFFNYFNKPAQSANIVPGNAATPTPVPTKSIDEIPNPEIKAADVKSVSIRTVYKGYFEAGSKCAKTYNEYFGNEDGVGSSSSPCTITITFSRDGKAKRFIEIRRYDKTIKGTKVVESSDETGTVTPAQFDAIANTIVTNQAFKDWREGTMINVSNCTISVEYTGGTKSPMSNVGESTVAYLPMVEAFKQLEKQISWNAK